MVDRYRPHRAARESPARLPDGWRTHYDRAVNAWERASPYEVVALWDDAFAMAEREHLRLLRNEQWVSGGSSLLGLLGLTRSEVHHSAILGWLLDPTGGHRLGTTVLSSFLDLIEIPHGHADLALTRSVRESGTVDPESGRDGSIDIVLEIPDLRRVVIEVKLWSAETNDQLDRYAAAHDGAHLVYLTPFGDPPRRSSVSVPKWNCISWRDHVLPMLEDRSGQLAGEGRSCAALAEYIVALSEELAP